MPTDGKPCGWARAQGKSQAYCSWHPEQIHAWRGSARNVFNIWWPISSLLEACWHSPCLQWCFFIADTFRRFWAGFAVLWRGMLRLDTLQKCKPLTPQSRHALMLYTIYPYIPWLAFLIFCNVIWLVWIWIIFFFFYSFKLRHLGPRNTYGQWACKLVYLFRGKHGILIESIQFVWGTVPTILLLSTQELTENIQPNPSVVMLAGLFVVQSSGRLGENERRIVKCFIRICDKVLHFELL